MKALLLVIVVCFRTTRAVTNFCKIDHRPKSPTIRGECDYAIGKWFYDESVHRCFEFKGDCPTGHNVFDTKSKCESVCSSLQNVTDTSLIEEAICRMEMNPTNCTNDPSDNVVWFYDPAGRCDACSFDGLDNFPNKFPSYETCFDTCVANPRVQAEWKVPSCALCNGQTVECFPTDSPLKESTCKCRRGFFRNSTGISCEDLDECDHSALNKCPVNSFCKNTYGGYTCESKPMLPSTSFVLPAPLSSLPKYPLPFYPSPSSPTHHPFPNQTVNPQPWYNNRQPWYACIPLKNVGFGRGINYCGSRAKQMFHFDFNTKTCRPFFYYGCGGNRNKFISQYDCEKTCQVESGYDNRMSANPMPNSMLPHPMSHNPFIPPPTYYPNLFHG